MTIRLYTYSGYIEVDRQPFLKEPYLGRAVVQPGETSKPDAAPAATRLAHLSSDFNCCTYEITPEGHTQRTADKDSPKLLGEKIVAFGPGWTLSVWHPNCEVKAAPALAPDRMTEAADAPG